MSCEPSYAWTGLNLLLIALACAVVIGVGIAFFYSLQEWLDSASKRRAEFINSIKSRVVAKRR